MVIENTSKNCNEFDSNQIYELRSNIQKKQKKGQK